MSQPSHDISPIDSGRPQEWSTRTAGPERFLCRLLSTLSDTSCPHFARPSPLSPPHQLALISIKKMFPADKMPYSPPNQSNWAPSMASSGRNWGCPLLSPLTPENDS